MAFKGLGAVFEVGAVSIVVPDGCFAVGEVEAAPFGVALVGVDSAYLAGGEDVGREYKNMVAWINRDLGSSTLKYQKLADMITAIGLTKEKLCTYCWTGKEPKNGAKNVHKKR